MPQEPCCVLWRPCLVDDFLEHRLGKLERWIFLQHRHEERSDLVVVDGSRVAEVIDLESDWREKKSRGTLSRQEPARENPTTSKAVEYSARTHARAQHQAESVLRSGIGLTVCFLLEGSIRVKHRQGADELP